MSTSFWFVRDGDFVFEVALDGQSAKAHVHKSTFWLKKGKYGKAILNDRIGPVIPQGQYGRTLSLAQKYMRKQAKRPGQLSM